jgi:hypothetical protein
MTKSGTEPYIIPDEATPRLYGRITILIASFLLVGNLVILGGYAAKPFMEPIGKRFELWANRMVEEEFAKTHARLKKDEATAATPQEKAAAVAALARFEGRPKPRINTMSMSFAATEPPVVWVYGVLDGVAGLVLNVALLIAAIKLVNLRASGLRAILWVAAIKLARIAVFGVVMMGWVMPLQIRLMRERMAEAFAPGQGGGGVPTMTPEIFAAMVSSSVVVYGLLATIFPILLLVQLRKPRVKAACLVEDSARDGRGS